MKTTILILALLIQQSAFAGSAEEMMQIKASRMEETSERLIQYVYSNNSENLITDLSDFRTIAEAGISFSMPEFNLFGIKCLATSEWNESAFQLFREHILEVYKDGMPEEDLSWLENTFRHVENSKLTMAVIYWEYELKSEFKSMKSFALFDTDGKVVYDSKIVCMVTGETYSDVKSEEESGSTLEGITNEKTGSKSFSWRINGGFNSYTDLDYSITMKGTSPPYVVAATNDAFFNAQTNSISIVKTSSGLFPPNVTYPFMFFGSGGTYTVLYENSVPYKSTITINNQTDHFNDGIYEVFGNNGRNWSFTFDFSVDVGIGIGITPQQDVSVLNLTPVETYKIRFDNHLYDYFILTGDIRAIFYHGGSLRLRNFNIMTSGTAGEYGTISMSFPLRFGYFEYAAPSSWSPRFSSTTNQTLNINNIEYLRGDHVLQPEYELTSTRYNIAVGQVDTLKLKVTNKSRKVKLQNGNVSIDASSLGGKLTLLSSATLPVGTIDTSTSKTFRFTVIGAANGVITPQASISAMGWESPVPPSVTINNITSIDNNIDVGPLTKTLTLTSPVQGLYMPGINSSRTDTMRVYIANGVPPYNLLDSAKALMNSSGTAVLQFTKINNGVPYYLKLKHRNSLETWSAGLQVFNNSDLQYDFSTAAGQAFGSNLALIDNSPVTYGIFSGDINRDGAVDASDLSGIDNDASNFTGGYVITDITGDSFVDGTDYSVADNNAVNFISAVAP